MEIREGTERSGEHPLPPRIVSEYWTDVTLHVQMYERNVGEPRQRPGTENLENQERLRLRVSHPPRWACIDSRMHTNVRTWIQRRRIMFEERERIGGTMAYRERGREEEARGGDLDMKFFKYKMQRVCDYLHVTLRCIIHGVLKVPGT